MKSGCQSCSDNSNPRNVRRTFVTAMRLNHYDCRARLERTQQTAGNLRLPKTFGFLRVKFLFVKRFPALFL